VISPPESKQVEILLKVQRLLVEGGCVASYKFALLQAVLDHVPPHANEAPSCACASRMRSDWTPAEQ
jgi:hypothetical protein